MALTHHRREERRPRPLTRDSSSRGCARPRLCGMRRKERAPRGAHTGPGCGAGTLGAGVCSRRHVLCAVAAGSFSVYKEESLHFAEFLEYAV